MKILVAIDFSEPSLDAMRQAKAIAERTGASLLLTWVEPEATHAPSGAAIYGTALQEVRELIAQLRAETEARLRALTDELEAAGFKADTCIELGDAAEMLVKVAEREGAGLVVTGTKGRTGFKRFFLGSVASKMARTCPVPVLVARGTVERFKRVLVAVDFSPASERALALAAQFAARGADIDVCHVWRYPPGILGVDTPEPEDGPFSGLRDELVSRANARGNALLRRYTTDDVSMRFVLEYGLPAGKLQELIEAGSYDLVAMGTHGYHGLQRFLLGSVAENTVRHAPCSVMVTQAAPPSPSSPSSPSPSVNE